MLDVLEIRIRFFMKVNPLQGGKTMYRRCFKSGRPWGSYHVAGALESSWELVKRFLWYLLVLDFWRSRGKNLTSRLNRHASIETLVSLETLLKWKSPVTPFFFCPFSSPFFFQRILWDFKSTSSFCENRQLSVLLFFLTTRCSGNFFSQYCR